MMSMLELNRRKFLQGLSMGLAAPLLNSTALFGSERPTKLPLGGFYASSRQQKNGQNEAVIFSPVRGDQRVMALPGRAHDVTAHPFKQEVVAVARRPGRFLVVFSKDKTKPALSLSAKQGRHFQGHGVFSKDGTLFFSAESDYEGERGVIGVRDVEKGYQQIAEFESHGIGIHEINLHPDGKTLVVANGGILTHPDMGRAKLNLRTMQPSLAYLDAQTGKLLDKQILPKRLHQLSIRHFATAPNGVTVFGCQFQGVKQKRPALVGFHKRGEEPVLVKAPKLIHRAMQNYIGSVAIDQSGIIAATSAPRGNLVAFWHIAERRFISSVSFKDGCGLAPTEQAGHFLMSNGLGEVVDFDVQTGRQVSSAYQSNGQRWDNHMLAFSS